MGFFSSIVSKAKSAVSSAVSSAINSVKNSITDKVRDITGSISSKLSRAGGLADLESFGSSAGALKSITSSIPRALSNTFTFGDSKAVVKSMSFGDTISEVTKLAGTKLDVVKKITAATDMVISSDADLSKATNLITDKFAAVSFPNVSKVLPESFDFTDTSNHLINRITKVPSIQEAVQEYTPFLTSTPSLTACLPTDMDFGTYSSMKDKFSSGLSEFTSNTDIAEAFSSTAQVFDTDKIAETFSGYIDDAIKVDMPVFEDFPDLTGKLDIDDCKDLVTRFTNEGAPKMFSSLVSVKSTSIVDGVIDAAKKTVISVKDDFTTAIKTDLDNLHSKLGVSKDIVLCEPTVRNGSIVNKPWTNPDIVGRVYDIDVIKDVSKLEKVTDYYLGDKKKLLTELPKEATVSTWTNPDIAPVSWKDPDKQDVVLNAPDVSDRYENWTGVN